MTAVTNTLPVDEAVRVLKYLSVQYGEQHLVRFEGSNSMIVLVNPSDGRKPYFYYQDRGFEDEIELGVNDA